MPRISLLTYDVKQAMHADYALPYDFFTSLSPSFLKVWRVKTLLSQIRTAHEEWKQRGSHRTESQYVMNYPADCPFNDAASLIIHHVKRQTTLSKEDKGRIKALVRRTFTLLFHQETTPLSDDEEDTKRVVRSEKDKR